MIEEGTNGSSVLEGFAVGHDELYFKHSGEVFEWDAGAEVALNSSEMGVAKAMGISAATA